MIKSNGSKIVFPKEFHSDSKYFKYIKHYIEKLDHLKAENRYYIRAMFDLSSELGLLTKEEFDYLWDYNVFITDEASQKVLK